MENQSYYLTDQHESDFCDGAMPLRLNCIGYVKMLRPFSTENVRRDWYLQLADNGTLQTSYGPLRPGQFLLYAPQSPYHYHPLGQAPIGYYWAHFTGAQAEPLLSQTCGLRPHTIYTLDESRMETVRREFSAIFRECMLRRGGYHELAAAMTAALLIRLGRATESDTADAENVLRKRLEHSLTVLHNHFTEPLCVAELARAEHLSESRFRELFRTAFGAPPGEYLIGLRIAYAIELLTTTDLPIAEISESCGYSDVLYFCRLFSRKCGLPPARYRKYHKNGTEKDIGQTEASL